MAETNNLEQLTDVRLSSSSRVRISMFSVHFHGGASAEYPFLPSSSRKGSISWSSTKPNLRSASKDSCMSYHDLKFKNVKPWEVDSESGVQKNMEQEIYCVRPDHSVCNTSKFGSLRVRWFGPVRFFWGARWCKKIAESFGYLILLLYFLAEGSFKPPWSVTIKTMTCKASQVQTKFRMPQRQ